MENQGKEIAKQPHHERDQLCTTRPPYRQGKKLTAVKVYTVNDESQHLLIRGVPALNLQKEMKYLCMRYGEVKLIHQAKNYSEDEEQFTEVFHVLYARIQSARFAKHMIDDKSFFGGVLHVCYAPELETLAETKHKLEQRKYDVLKRVRKYKADELRKARRQESTNASQFDGSDADHYQAIPNNHFQYFNKSIPEINSTGYTSNECVQSVPGSSTMSYMPYTSTFPLPSTSGICNKSTTSQSSYAVSQVPNCSQKSFTEAGLISCEFIPRQKLKMGPEVNSNPSASGAKSEPSTNKKISNAKRSTAVKLDDKFIPPQVKRIKFNHP